MRYVVSRLCGLLNRQIATYKKLVDEMLLERKALLERDIKLIKESLEKQQVLVDELYDIMRDYDEEVDYLYKEMGLTRRSAKKDEEVLTQKLGKDALKMKQLGDHLKQVVMRAKKINKENQKIIEVSNSFFRSYFYCLQQLKSQILGYTPKAKADTRYTENIYINQHF